MAKWLIRIAAILAGVALVVLSAGYLWFQYAVKRSQPQLAGEVAVSGYVYYMVGQEA